MKTIKVSDDVYDYLKGMIDDEHVSNSDDSEERNANGETVAHKPSFSEVISHLIEDRESATVGWQITEERKAAIMETIDLLNGDLFRSPYSDVLAVLRGMLTEADHDKP